MILNLVISHLLQIGRKGTKFISHLQVKSYFFQHCAKIMKKYLQMSDFFRNFVR